MRAGLLNQTITLYKPLKTKDDFGADIITWEKIKNTKALITHSAQSKQVINNEIIGENRISCSIRIYNDITLDMRIESRGILYNVESVYPDYTKQIKVIELTEVNE